MDLWDEGLPRRRGIVVPATPRRRGVQWCVFQAGYRLAIGNRVITLVEERDRQAEGGYRRRLRTIAQLQAQVAADENKGKTRNFITERAVKKYYLEARGNKAIHDKFPKFAGSADHLISPQYDE